MTRQQTQSTIIAGILILICTALFLVRCPWSVCRYLGLHVYTITTLHEYREFLSDEVAFAESHRAVTVRLSCSQIRDDVVRGLNDGRLALSPAKEASGATTAEEGRQLRAWRQGMVLHVARKSSATLHDHEQWATRVNQALAQIEHEEVAVLPRLFGGVIVHSEKTQQPTVLFAKERCI